MENLPTQINQAFTKISFYIVAHADDWQLFMQPNAYKDLVSEKSKVVFIITTAGDAAKGVNYWRSREEGMKSSVRFCLAPLNNITESTGSRNLAGHTITYFSINNTTCYFFRLPDGNIDGSGFRKHKNQSLLRFRNGNITTMNAIDKSAGYKNWNDLVITLQEVIEYESRGILNKWINYMNPSTDINPNDHADHICTGKAIQEMKIISELKQVLFIGYSTGSNSEQLNSTDLFWKSGMFAAYEKAVFDSSGYSTLHEGVNIYLKWCLSSAKFSIVNVKRKSKTKINSLK